MQKRDHLSDIKEVDVSLEIKALPEDEIGVFEGYGAVFGNIDSDGDIIAKGAFADSLRLRTPKMLWQHNAREPIGVFTEVKEDENGLYVKGKLINTGRGAEAYELLKMGALDGMSVGFKTKQASRDHGTGRRTIMQAELMEVSLVTFPANELATVTAVKSLNGLSMDMDTKSDDTDYKKDGVIVFDAAINMAKSILGFGGAVEYTDTDIAEIEQIYKTAGFVSPFSEDAGFIDQKMVEKMATKEIEKALRQGARFSRDAAKAALSQREVAVKEDQQREVEDKENQNELKRALAQLEKTLTK